LGFSNGEKQKLLLAMVTSKKPSLIVLDESTSFLSAIDSINTITWLKENNPNAIIILATHDMLLANKMDHTLSLNLTNKNKKVFIT
ncbi:ATP-binding cassette domain-containing protein, partial [Vibrio owensii]|uniref:ATP-binding cassette domain-containing protein n=1 Tax=Vibrio owensii TaxID=696485 RepID=UPI003AAF27D0